MNHPNRSFRAPSLARNPTPEEIRAAREAAGLTQTAAASLLYRTLRNWQQWESAKESPDHRRMDPALWELFKIKTGRATAIPIVQVKSLPPTNT